ncbi:FkbM family methyltransferase [Natronomonas halophila]|uniref:FkbM family methyltransferase n=1 Tax=Natronomonas halophila TaxID=2747817 RepID=UPI0015B39F6E|nr:FkbM family methyltransferase [Natronomonas halophila]QLD86844.1 FkbM family methyltransferase [Natronomonas halophila]
MGGNRVEYYGITLDLSSDQIDRTQKASFVYETYEEPERELIDEFVPEDRDVLELGASIGFISCYLDAHLSASSQQYVVEANPRLLSTLERNRGLNDADFEICHAAYAATDEEVSFTIVENFLASSVQRTDGKAVDIPALSLRDAIDRWDLDGFVLVADVEGAEYELVEHEIDDLASHCAYILIEFHTHGAESIGPAKQMLKEAGFELLAAKQGGTVCLFQNRRQ